MPHRSSPAGETSHRHRYTTPVASFWPCRPYRGSSGTRPPRSSRGRSPSNASAGSRPHRYRRLLSLRRLAYHHCLVGEWLMLVGDSMNRNQLESMLCILREALPDKTRMFETHGYRISKARGYFVFKFGDYDCTVEFVRSHFLAREGVRFNRQKNSNPILQIDPIDKTANRWKKADVLVFNTGHWWTHGKTARGKNYKEGDTLYPQFDSTEAYRRALKTWARWIDKNMDPARSIVFYRGYSSAHFRGGDWDSGGSCNGETERTFKRAIIDSYPVKMRIVEEAIGRMRFPVRLLNVTKLTNFRRDGHPSVYCKAGDKKVYKRKKQDCSHWCHPGVPDAWNELIYASLVLESNPVAWKNR